METIRDMSNKVGNTLSTGRTSPEHDVWQCLLLAHYTALRLTPGCSLPSRTCFAQPNPTLIILI